MKRKTLLGMTFVAQLPHGEVILADENGKQELWLSLGDDGYEFVRTATPWDLNDIQFPRLLCEIFAVGLTKYQLEALSASMDLSQKQIKEILERADLEWERICHKRAEEWEKENRDDYQEA